MGRKNVHSDSIVNQFIKPTHIIPLQHSHSLWSFLLFLTSFILSLIGNIGDHCCWRDKLLLGNGSAAIIIHDALAVGPSVMFGENDGGVLLRWETLSPSALIANYTEHLAWSLFLTSTAIHAILLITSPLLIHISKPHQAVYKWYRRQSSDSDTPIPYLCAIIGSLLWLRYSIFIHDLKLILLQGYAVLMQTFFLFAMLFYRSKKRRLLRSIMGVFVGIALLFFFIAQLPPKVGHQFTGICASGAQILGSLVCPYLIYKAISSKFIDFVPFAPVAFTWIMELHAIIYSVGVNDIYLLTANSVFFTMDGLLLSMFFVYPSEKSQATLEHKLINKVNTL